MKYFLVFVSFFVCIASGVCEDRITESPLKTFKIIQHMDQDGWSESLQFIEGHHDPVVLEFCIPWPADFNISPDGQWILRIQKSGSGDNISYLYHVDDSHSVWRMEEQIGALGFAFLRKLSNKLPKEMYHEGIDFDSWDMKSGLLKFSIHASSDNGDEIDQHLTYNLQKHTIELSKSDEGQKP